MTLTCDKRWFKTVKNLNTEITCEEFKMIDLHLSPVYSRFITINVSSNISYENTYNLPNAQIIRLKTLSKQQNTKILMISVQIIIHDCYSGPFSYLYIKKEL